MSHKTYCNRGIKLQATAILLAVGLPLLPGCSSDSDDRPEAFIGVLGPFTGSLQTFGRAILYGAGFAVGEINQNGGVLGHRLKIIGADTKGDRAIARAKTKELIDQGAVAIIGAYTSDATKQLIIEARNSGVVVISPSSGATSLSDVTDKGCFFRTAPSDAFQGEVAADHVYAKPLGKKKVTILYSSDEDGTSLAGVFNVAFLKYIGSDKEVEVSEFVSVAPMSDAELDKYTFDEEAKTVLKDQPNSLVVLSMGAKEAAKFTFRASGMIDNFQNAPTFLGFGLLHTEDFLLNCTPDVGRRFVGSVPTIPKSAENNFSLFSDNFEALHGTIPSTHSASSYDAVYLVSYALERAAGKNTSGDPLQLRTKIKDHMRAVSGPGYLDGTTWKDTGGGPRVGVDRWSEGVELIKSKGDIDYDGASGPVDWDAKGDTSSAAYVLWHVQEGANGRLAFEQVGYEDKQANRP
jgi:branched-chain amino acid transport system substrate-binding protein